MRKMFRCTSPLTRTTLPASYSDIDSRTSFKKPVRGAPHDETPLKSNPEHPSDRPLLKDRSLSERSDSARRRNRSIHIVEQGFLLL
jgi:hypothetical protein